MIKRVKLFGIVCILILLTTGQCFAGKPKIQVNGPKWTDVDGFMVFTANLDGVWHLFSWVKDSKENPVRLTHSSWDQRRPSVSPGRDLVAYSSTDGELFLMDLKTRASTPIKVDGFPGNWDQPSFSPNGKKLVCSYLRPGGKDRAELAVIDLESKRVEVIPLQYGPQSGPAWSPKDLLIAYVYGHCSAACERLIQEIWVTGFSTKSYRQLTLTNSNCTDLAWSSDGKKIAFSSDMSGNFDIWMVDVQSGKMTQVTRHPAMDESPAFSPDGKEIAFISTRTGKRAIWLKDLKTGKETQLRPFKDRDVEIKDLVWK
jgi:TolB protein